MPRVLGTTCPHIVPVLHSFFGSSALVIPWVPKPFLETGSIAGRTTWICMPRYVMSLESATEAMPCTGPREAALWLLGGLEATQHMLARGAVHRDVKADNFFLAGDGRLVLGDFGCSRLMFTGGIADELESQFQSFRRQMEASTGAASSSGGEAGASEDILERLLGAGARGASASAASGASCAAPAPPAPDSGSTRSEAGAASRPVQSHEAFRGAGPGSKQVTYSTEALAGNGAPMTMAPELWAM